jgi:hypothetical protein
MPDEAAIVGMEERDRPRCGTGVFGELATILSTCTHNACNHTHYAFKSRE